MPWTEEQTAAWRLAGALLAELEREAGIPHIDLLSGFQSHYSAAGQRRFWPEDGHWNSAGYQRAAELDHQALEEMGVVLPQEERILPTND
jgi:hypothetical protein